MVEDEHLNVFEEKYDPDGFMDYGFALMVFTSGDEGERKIASLNFRMKR
jgi:hypothetical protein